MHPATYVGRAVVKMFGGRKYPGKVLGYEYDDDDGVNYYQLEYDDGDSEEVNVLELLELL